MENTCRAIYSGSREELHNPHPPWLSMLSVRCIPDAGSKQYQHPPVSYTFYSDLFGRREQKKMTAGERIGSKEKEKQKALSRRFPPPNPPAGRFRNFWNEVTKQWLIGGERQVNRSPELLSLQFLFSFVILLGFRTLSPLMTSRCVYALHKHRNGNASTSFLCSCVTVEGCWSWQA